MHSARTVGGDAVVLALVILRTTMYINLEVLLTERVLAVLAVEGQKVDEKASGVGALLSDAEKRCVAFRSGRKGRERHLNDRECEGTKRRDTEEFIEKRPLTRPVAQAKDQPRRTRTPVVARRCCHSDLSAP